MVCDVKYLYTLHCIGIIYLFIYYYYLCVLIKLDISSSVFSCLLIYFALFDELTAALLRWPPLQILFGVCTTAERRFCRELWKCGLGRLGKYCGLLGCGGQIAAHGAARPRSPHFVILKYHPHHHILYFFWSVQKSQCWLYNTTISLITVWKMM